MAYLLRFDFSVPQPEHTKVEAGLTDPMTLRLRNEEEWLASIAGCREEFYRNHLLPFKLRGYCEYLHRRAWRSDVGVLLKTVLLVLRPELQP